MTILSASRIVAATPSPPIPNRLTLSEKGQMLAMPGSGQRAKGGDARLHEERLQLRTIENPKGETDPTTRQSSAHRLLLFALRHRLLPLRLLQTLRPILLSARFLCVPPYCFLLTI